LLFLVPAISQTHKSLENSQDFFVKTKTKTFTSRPRPRLYFLSSRRLETKTLVSRTTSLVCTPGQHRKAGTGISKHSTSYCSRRRRTWQRW